MYRRYVGVAHIHLLGYSCTHDFFTFSRPLLNFDKFSSLTMSKISALVNPSLPPSVKIRILYTSLTIHSLKHFNLFILQTISHKKSNVFIPSQRFSVNMRQKKGSQIFCWRIYEVDGQDDGQIVKYKCWYLLSNSIRENMFYILSEFY